MKKLILLAAVCILNTTLLKSQECDCLQNYDWVKKTFEENDAGFAFALQQKGEQAYADHNKRIEERVQKATTLAECTQILYEWLTFFRSGHISIWLHEQNQQSGMPASGSEPPSDWETFDVDIQDFKTYLSGLEEYGFEGIWEMSSYTVGVKRFGEEYIGFIVESAHEIWKQGHVKLRFTVDDNRSDFVFYLYDRFAVEREGVQLLGNNHLLLGNAFRLNRVYPAVDAERDFSAWFRLLESREPYLERLDASTLYLRIPSFQMEFKQAIDNLLEVNREEILRTQNLIIDIRNGTGGSDASYYEILPFLYTNPIRNVGVEFLSTPLNNQRMLDFIYNDEYGLTEEQKQWARGAFEKLEKRPGEFVNLNEEVTSITRLDTVFSFPQNVGIIINERNGSTDEQFLLAARQSRKVKLFGRSTYGVLDISNMYFVESPCKEFELGYALSRSLRIPGYTIDERGVQPDFYLDKSIPEYDWVNFVKEVLNQQD
ncbi:MAG: S41 family peptidase [Bacteroidales bacterium]